MKKIILVLLSIVSLVSCDTKKEKPNPFFEHDKMVDFMTDMSLAEGTRIYTRAARLERKEGEYSINDYYAMVLEKYNITQAQLDSINAWYIYYPEENQAIFKDVLDRLNKLQAEQTAVTKEKEKKRLDLTKAKREKAKAKLDTLKIDDFTKELLEQVP